MALKSITEAIRKVEVNTVKAATELALMRLEAQVRDLTEKSASIRKKRDDDLGKGVSSILPLLVGLVFVSAHIGSFGWVILLVGIALACGVWAGAKAKNDELSSLDSQTRDLQSKMQDKKRIVEG